MFLSKIQEIIKEQSLLGKETPILTGVSGGPDSLCLMDALHRLGYPLVVAHFNHHLREESAADQAFVLQAARQRELPFVTGEGDVREFSQKERQSIEESARTLRYQFLFEQARKFGAQAVAVGHTADDQVETVIMHILRGAGLDGLTGMRNRSVLPNWSTEIPLVRPLLTLWRQEVLDYCQQNHLSPRFDRSNEDTTYFRNRLRHELIPRLQTFQPRVGERIIRMAQVLAADREIVLGVADAAWRGVVVRRGVGFICMSKSVFLEHPLGMQWRMIRRAIKEFLPAQRDVDFDTAARAAEFIQPNRHHGRCDLSGGLQVFLEGDLIWVAAREQDLPTDEWPQIPNGQVIRLPAGAKVALPGGWWFTSKLSTTPGQQREAFQVWLDADSLTFPLSIQSRRPGDRFQPLGMRGRTMKLSDFMINQKLPRRARARWPLVWSGESIAWVPGFRPGEPFRITSQTKRFLHLQLARE